MNHFFVSSRKKSFPHYLFQKLLSLKTNRFFHFVVIVIGKMSQPDIKQPIYIHLFDSWSIMRKESWKELNIHILLCLTLNLYIFFYVWPCICTYSSMCDLLFVNILLCVTLHLYIFSYVWPSPWWGLLLRQSWFAMNIDVSEHLWRACFSILPVDSLKMTVKLLVVFTLVFFTLKLQSSLLFSGKVRIS